MGDGRALTFLFFRTLRNRLLSLLRKPLSVILLVVALLYAVGMPVLMAISNESILPLEWMGALSIGVSVYFFFLLWSISFKADRGLFRLADTNLLFPSPIRPNRILLYSSLNNMLGGFAISLVIGVYLLVFTSQGAGWLGSVMTILMVAFAAMAVLCIAACAYLWDIVRPGMKKGFYYAGLAYMLVLAAVFFLFYQTSPDHDLQVLTQSLSQAAWFRNLPIIGWLSWGIQESVAGNFLEALLPLGLLGAVVAMTSMITLFSKVPYYERAAADADRLETLWKNTKASGNNIHAQLQKVHSVKNTAFRPGAASLFSRQILEKRKAGFAGIGVNIIFLVYAIMFKFMGQDFTLTGGMLCLSCMIATISDTWLMEFKKPFIYLIPDSSFKKAFYSTLASVIVITASIAITMVVSYFLYNLSILSAICWFLLVSSYGLLVVYTTVWSFRILGSSSTMLTQTLLRVAIMLAAAIPAALLLIPLILLSCPLEIILVVLAMVNAAIAFAILFFSRRLFEVSEMLN